MVTTILIGLVSAVVVLATALPLIRTPLGIIRICEFPRPQILVAAVGCLIAIFFYFGPNSWATMSLAPFVALATLGQAARIAPYTPLYPKESPTPAHLPAERCLKLLIANVLQENREAQRLVDLIDRHDPDVVFVVEVDAWWREQLAEVAERYKHVSGLPQDNNYGLLFLSRVPVTSCEVRHLVKPDIPSVKARLELKSGQAFWFYGLHPQPPLPTQDAEDRNTELLIVAREVRDHREPSIIAGDLNDVAWSRTNHVFQRVSGALDPRVGRGLYATFHARYWIARWPLDHLFYTREFAIEKLEVLPNIGSDHFPVLGWLGFAAKGPSREPAERPSSTR